MKISIVAAMDRNRVIGFENKIPWKLPSDLKRLADLTRNKFVIVGRKSYESMILAYNGRPLPGALYLVLSRNAEYLPLRGLRVGSLDVALEISKTLGESFVIGGSAVFREALPLAAKIYLTEVQAEVAGDSYFPVLGEGWREIKREHHSKDEKNEYDFDFVTFVPRL